MRVHIGCGSVYLEGYINVDMRGPKTFLAKERPDLVESLKTTDDKYYARHQDKTIDKLRKGPLDQEMVCDEYGSFFDLPGSTWTLTEILARHVFEHMSLSEAHRALDECDRKMKEGGILRLDVPDHEGTLKKYVETQDQFYVRHLFGPRKNEYGYHIMSYTRELLKKVVESHGFVFVEEEPNIHFYPAFCLKFMKPMGGLPRDYALRGRDLAQYKAVLDIGPGPFPLLQATHYMDVSENYLKQIPGGRVKVVGDIQKRTIFNDKEFDFVFCSHVLEHVDNPQQALAEISRIGKAGVVVVPSAFKEFMFLWEEDDHHWWIFPPASPGGPIRFMQKNMEWAQALGDTDASKAMCRLFRTGPNTVGPDQRTLRKWFYKNEPNLDVIVAWEGSVCAEYIG